MGADLKTRSNEPMTAVVLAGGKGTRLHPYTMSFPKPLVPVGDRPILEILLGQLVRDGFRHFVFAVGHLAELIEAYFGDGSRWGKDVTIEYVREESALGTAGPLAQMADRLPAHFLVINGDVLCDLDFAAFMAAHLKNEPARVLSISTHRRILSSEYGVLNCTTEGLVREYSEKPSYHLAVSEGVYAFSREVLSWVPRQQRFDFPDLVHRLLRENLPILACEHSGLWLDIGRPEDYEEAQRMVSSNPDRFSLFPHRSTHPDSAPAPVGVANSGNQAETALPYRIQMADSFERT